MKVTKMNVLEQQEFDELCAKLFNAMAKLMNQPYDETGEAMSNFKKEVQTILDITVIKKTLSKMME